MFQFFNVYFSGRKFDGEAAFAAFDGFFACYANDFAHSF
jgi:hypothetical protein